MTASGGWCRVKHPSLGQCDDYAGHEGRHYTSVWGGACWWQDPQHDEDYEFSPQTLVEHKMHSGYVARIHVNVDPRADEVDG